MDYFEKKFDEIMGCISEWRTDELYITDRIKNDIISILKIIAKDQRYTCVDNFSKEYSALDKYSDNVVKILHNSNIK